MKRWILFFSVAFAALLTLGCATLDEKQRAWIFQPSDRAWGSSADLARDMDPVWIDFSSSVTRAPARLHGLWLAADGPKATQGPVLLYLHGARWNVEGSAPRMRGMQALGFSVLAIDYRGFGKSTSELPSEATAYEDARAAWDWLAAKYPHRDRYIFGHSLGGAIAIDLAAQVDDERGTIVEGTFSSIRDLADTMSYGWLQGSWLPGALITQRFDSMDKVAKINSPLLVVHGENDNLIARALGRKLYDAARGPKKFMLVAGGSHFSTMSMGQTQYRDALAQLFSIR
ncbi:MAG: lysophospholipase [Pseudomonadota bacterium]|nr:lysophospholipase [Pseudomonadota bacterium]